MKSQKWWYLLGGVALGYFVAPKLRVWIPRLPGGGAS